MLCKDCGKEIKESCGSDEIRCCNCYFAWYHAVHYDPQSKQFWSPSYSMFKNTEQDTEYEKINNNN